MEYTLSIIKPDAMRQSIVGRIVDRFERNDLQIVAMKFIKMTEVQVKEFYYMHAERSFFQDLVQYMVSGPIIVQVIKGVDAIAKNREIMGATDPRKAKLGTIRADFARSIEENCVHGSDSAEAAQREIAFFFSKSELLFL